ncbi:MAG: hypothetical protein RIQ53_2932 [Pseudomonadota bacterium]
MPPTRSQTLPSLTNGAPGERPAAPMPRWMRGVLPLLQRLQHAQLELHLPDGRVLHCGRTQAQAEASGGTAPAWAPAHAVLRLQDWQVVGDVLRAGDIGLAEAWIDGRWSTPDLPALLKLLLANRDALERLVYGSWWGSLMHRVRHWLNRNDRRGSERNIHAHYDLGNAFYRLWLDPTMSYSSAWFDGRQDLPMAQAQQAKIARALRACGLQPGQGSRRVLEIGCGWGALAEVAARDFDARVNGVTLSHEQLAWARERIDRAGLADRVDLRYQDYRDIADGPYDAIVSIEMIEAVGREWWPTYFSTLKRLLAPGGRACVQSIVIQDQLFERYAAGTDFIQQYVFPGGMLPCPAEVRAQAARAGLTVVDELCFGRDYAETLRRWRADFLQRQTDVRALGFDTRFLRIWDFYLAYCEAAFDAGNTDVVQYTFAHA